MTKEEEQSELQELEDYIASLDDEEVESQYKKAKDGQ